MSLRRVQDSLSLELGSELLQREAQPALDRAERHSHARGDLGLAESFEVAELERLALGVRQRSQRRADGHGLEAAERLLVGTLGRLLLAVEVELGVPVAPSAPNGVDRAVAGDRQQPA